MDNKNGMGCGVIVMVKLNELVNFYVFNFCDMFFFCNNPFCPSVYLMT